MKKLKRAAFFLRHTPLHPQWMVFRNDRSNRRHSIDHLRGRVLDVGCGNGWVAEMLAADCYYIGFDYPITVTKGYTGKPDVMGTATQLPFREETFDSVALLDVLEHLAIPNLALHEISRVLKSGGRLVLQVPFLYPLHDVPQDYQRWTHWGLERMLQVHGFSIIEQRRFGEPLETAAALQCIALVHAGLLAFERSRRYIVLLPFIALTLPIINLASWVLTRLLPKHDFMPLGYKIIAEKV